MSLFEQMLEEYRVVAERFVKFRIPLRADAEDVLQEVYALAYQNFTQLKNKDSFKFWLLSIARNKCNDYFRKQAGNLEISIEALEEKQLADSRFGVAEVSMVQETLERLGEKDKQILYLYFWKELPQAEIAKRLDIPVGTVKSRLYTAKQNFKKQYPYQGNVNLWVLHLKESKDLLSLGELIYHQQLHLRKCFHQIL